MKYAYVVIGSEDGNISVTGSLKKAYTEAVDYISNSCDGLTGELLTFSEVSAKIKAGYVEVSVTASTQNFADASIQRFEVL